MKVLSLFDGISCGMVALERAEIPVERYVAYEIDKYAIQVSEANYPQIEHMGDVTTADFTQYKGFDLLIGGSPCQNFSFAGKQKGMSTKDNVQITTFEQYLGLKDKGFQFDGQSYLFWEYIRALNEFKPKYFLLENVKMSKQWENIISQALKVNPIKINSSLVSAQKRERLYWSNIPNIEQPLDKKIKLHKILQNDIEHIFLPLHRQEYTNYDLDKVNKLSNPITAIQLGKSKQFKCGVSNDGKAFTLRKTECNGILDNDYKIRRFTPIEAERLQTLPDNYTAGISNTRRYQCIGNGWTVDVIAHILSGLKEDNPC